MEWLQSIFFSVLAVFGMGNGDARELAPVVSEVEQVVEETVAVVNDPVAVVEEVVATADEEVSEGAAEPDPVATEIADTADEMTGAAPAVTISQLDTSSVPDPTPATTGSNIQTALVAGGCFWCVEADLEKTPGIISAVSGYAGGSSANPTYQDYGSGGHREVVEVTYDANEISFEGVLIVTLKTTDPTDDSGTFKDRGDKYSAAFYYENQAQLDIINNLIAEVDQNGPYDQPLAIDIEPRPTFWPAEDFHQDYYKGTLTKLKYQFYRNASGRSDFISEHWGTDTSPTLPWRTNQTISMNDTTYPWQSYVKPSKEVLQSQLDPLAYRVTQEDGTERAGTSPLDKVWEDGIYVDILSGAPLYSSRDKFDSGTGWPSFVKPITPDAITEHEDRKLFTVRTETRSRYGDNHIGHVFADGPADRGGLRYCMNGAALRFVPKADMVAEGYEDFLQYL